ncbi:MAG TPA: DEAD/DEAH box helicase family protein, partial [Spirochaetota bacterium]|nr:DEAD/DEAH box helicase family protein [Spirochaetota bacterium]
MLFEKQRYQEDCVNNIISVLKDYDFERNDANELKSNLSLFYKQFNIPKKELSDKLKLDILMETGTGKTFAYIKTIFELNKNYGLNKFIIFVPRKAIREGVIQNINLTSNYFFEEYGKRLHKYTYDGDKSIGSIKTHFIRNKDELSVLILTAASIDKETNILRRSDENLFRDKSIFDALTKINPIIFIDEPHLLKGESFTKIFNLFNSLHIRFGATYPKESEHSLSNMIYSLDSLSSFKNYLENKT